MMKFHPWLRNSLTGQVQLPRPTAVLIPLVAGLLLWSIGCSPSNGHKNLPAPRIPAAGAMNWLTFHGDRARTGWNPNETILAPGNVAQRFGKLWDSPQFDFSGGKPPHLYASPLYVDSVVVTGGDFLGQRLGLAIAAASSGFVYAVNAFDEVPGPAGTIVWRARLGSPGGQVDGVRVGVLGTPAIDLGALPPRIYVAADVAEGGRAWRLFALDLGNGTILPGWPLVLTNSTISPLNGNGPATFQDPGRMSQRGGLNLSPDGTILYVPFGGYSDQAAGWMIAADTGIISGRPALLSAFSVAPEDRPRANGGIWASGGASVDASGNLYAVTGNSPAGPADRTWGQSILKWAPGVPLRLIGTYTPWNHCQLDEQDIDLCGSGVTLIPDLDPRSTSTPRLMAIGGKQGNAYLINRDTMPGALARRPNCNRLNPTTAPADGSLWEPSSPHAYYGGAPGPLNVFGPYAERDSMGNLAKARSTPAYFQAADRTGYLFFTGSTKHCQTCMEAVPPCIARVKINVTGPGVPAFLTLDGTENTLRFKSPGTPVVSSHGPSDPILWVVEPNVYRSESLAGSSRPTLYAVDGTTLQVLYRSNPSDFSGSGGKYYHPVVAAGVVFVGVDRISAFGLIESKGNL
jgi:hypothetical protein